MSKSLLQERVDELNSAIFTIKGNKIHLIGFYNIDRLLTNIKYKKDNWLSKGLYDVQDVTFENIKSNALFIVIKDGELVDKHRYSDYLREMVTRKYGKKGDITLTIRKHQFNGSWQTITVDGTDNFNTKDDLIIYLNDNFDYNFEI